MGAYVNLPVLSVPALFILGFAVSWWWASRSRRQQQHQLLALRADRHRLAQKLLLARDRLAKRQELGRRLKQDNERLLQAQNRLETEHAALAVSYANLQADIDASPIESFEVPTLGELARDEHHANAQWTTEDDPAANRFEDEAGASKVLHETRDIDDSLLTAVPAEGSIHKVSTRLLKSTAERAGENVELRQRAIKTLAAFEAELLADEPGRQMPQAPESADVDDESLSLLLADRDAEIDRLREQIAPLIGLPLAIAAREAERDQLARRLEQAETKLAALEGKFQRSPSPETGDRRAAQTERAETAPGLIDALNRADLEINGPMPEVSANTHIPPAVTVQQFDHVPDQVDNLKRIRGIGPVLERMLNRLGIYQYRQIAEWTEKDVAFFDSKLHDFRGRIERDNWIDGARRQVERQQAHAPQAH